MFDLDEVETAFRNYWQLGAVGEDWDTWCDQCFTDDVTYVEHILGSKFGREAEFKKVTGFLTQYSIFRQIAAGLPHQPDRWWIAALAIENIENGLCHKRYPTAEMSLKIHLKNL